MYSTTKEMNDALRRRQLLPMIKDQIVRVLHELDGMALTYELDKIAIIWGENDMAAAVTELIETGWIYIVRRRE